LFLLSLVMLTISCGYNDRVSAEIDSPTLPGLTGKKYNPVQKIRLIRDSTGVNREEYSLEKVRLSREGTTDISDIDKVMLVRAGENDKLETDHPVGEVQPTATKITFSNHFTVTEDTTILWVSVTLKKSIDLSHKIKIRCEEIVTDRGK